MNWKEKWNAKVLSRFIELIIFVRFGKEQLFNDIDNLEFSTVYFRKIIPKYIHFYMFFYSLSWPKTKYINYKDIDKIIWEHTFALYHAGESKRGTRYKFENYLWPRRRCSKLGHQKFIKYFVGKRVHFIKWCYSVKFISCGYDTSIPLCWKEKIKS